jgi:hypothetical protein
VSIAFRPAAADLDQRAQHREVIDLLREVARTDQRRARPGQAAPDRRVRPARACRIGLEHRPQRHRRRGMCCDRMRLDRFEDAAVERLEEMVGSELDLDVLGDAVVDHHRAQQRGFRLHILRQAREVRPAWAAKWVRARPCRGYPPPGASPQALLRKVRGADLWICLLLQSIQQASTM